MSTEICENGNRCKAALSGYTTHSKLPDHIIITTYRPNPLLFQEGVICFSAWGNWISNQSLFLARCPIIF